MRRWHRWAAIPAGLLLFFVALTGVLLHLDMIRVGQHPPGHDPNPPKAVVAMPTDRDLALMIGRLAAAARKEPGFKPQSLTIDLTPPQPVLVASAGQGPEGKQIRFDAVSGQRINLPPPLADFHYVLQDIHAGYFLGWTGRILSILVGLALIVLSVTGIEMWWTMRKRGQKGIYWK